MEPKAYWDIADIRVLDAIRRVPRERFVPDNLQTEAEEDHPLPIGCGQTISQPYIVAYMSAMLELDSTHTVLEVGTGSGYQSAVLAELAGEVYSIECIQELSQRAAGILGELGYTNVTTIVGNGRQGYEKQAPYQRILVTAASEDIPHALLEQLDAGGVMVIPIGPEGGVQHLYRCRRTEAGSIETERLLPVRFVPLVS